MGCDTTHQWLGGVAFAIAAYYEDTPAMMSIAAAVIVAQVGWWALKLPTATAAIMADVSFLRYTGSLVVWTAVGVLTYWFTRFAGLHSPETNLNQQAIVAATIAAGVGMQPILNNFAAGLLLVLFRPFRVGNVLWV